MDKNLTSIIETIKTELKVTTDHLTRLFVGEHAADKRIVYPLSLEGALKVITTGGYTLSPFRTTPTEGYVVSLKGHEVKYRVEELISADEGSDIVYALWAYMHARLHVLRRDNSAFFGAWHDEANDTLYLDVSVIVDNPHDAYRLAVENSQLAVYCLHWQESLDTTSPEAFTEAYERILQREND